MSTICHGFVQNAWRKDICSNCFRVRDEHSATEINNSAKNDINETNGGGNNNGVKMPPAIVPRNLNNLRKSGTDAGTQISSSASTPSENEGRSPNFSQKANRFQGTTNVNACVASINSNNAISSSTMQFGQQDSSCLQRISNGMATMGNGKLSGTNSNSNTHNSSTTFTTTKGQTIHSGLSGSKSNINYVGIYNNVSSTLSTEGNVKARNTSEGTLTKSTQLQSSYSHVNSKPQIAIQQGKGMTMMTNQHPSKSDNSSVIPNHNNNDNSNKPMTSSAAGVVSHLSSTTATIISTMGRNASSSYIASKNIFNNTHTSSSSSTSTSIHTDTTLSPTGSTSSQSTQSTAITITSGGSGDTASNSASNATGCMNGMNTGASASSSTGLSHPQSTNSIKRGNIVPSSSSTSVLASSFVALQQSQKVSGGGVGGGTCSGTQVDPVASSRNNGISGASHHNENLENYEKNEVIVGSNSSSRESPDGTAVISNINSSGSSIHSFCTSVNKEVIVITPQNGMMMNRSKMLTKAGGGGGGSGENILDRRKVGLSGVNGSNATQSGGDNVTKNGTVGKPTAAPRSKGILRSKNGHRKKEKNVRFPDEVVRVIGYGGGPSGISDDEDDSPNDPLDNASVNEVMEKNSNTLEEKELHRLTQKNTNFNSIKTNLLGTTCIEIGPIVGCTGGKSMEGSSKPLVSIGTFETRKEPLKIHKKISEDSADDELNEKTVEKHRRFTPRSSIPNMSSSGAKPPLPTTQAPNRSTSVSISEQFNSPKESEITKQRATVSTAKSIISNNSKTTTSSSSSSTTAINSIINHNNTNNETTVSSSKSSSSISTKNAVIATLTSENKGNGSSTTIEVKPEQTSSSCTITATNIIRSSKESIATSSSSSKSSSIPSSCTVANRITSSSGNSTSPVTTISRSKWSNNTTTLTSCNNNDGTSLRPKPVLKRIQKNPSDSSVSCSVNDETNKGSSSTTVLVASSSITDSNKINLNGRSNLIIQQTNEDNKSQASVSNNSIASKRSSFLRDIIVDSSSSTTSTTTVITTEGTQPNRTTETVQVICKNNEHDSLKKSELKVDLKPSVNNGKLSHPPFGECLSNRSNGTDDSSEFDDSLEDSGLDIKKCSENSESDEKSGSGSDSGNENDYDRDRVKIISTTGPKSGLFISVDEVDGSTKKPEKLSPDSVLFSSASEMSASGSSESIPEALDTVSDRSSPKDSTSSSSSTSSEPDSHNVSNGNAVGNTVNNVKRAAPRPPTTSLSDSSAASKNTVNNGIYANSQTTTTATEEIYDDVSFYKNPMHFPSTKVDNKTNFTEDEDEENIYDDCTTTVTLNKAGKSVIGSYNLQNSSHLLDSDCDEETEKVVQRRSDGIEFIGIRKIDSESFLRERSPTPDRSPDGKRERSSSASPKTRRKVNQFFSTIGKRAGAAFSQHVHAYKNKSNPVIEDSGIEKSPAGSSSAYKRSMSTDEVSITRTQEIYATLTPTSLKFKGLGPMMHKLSKIDLNLGDKDKGMGDDDDRLDGKEKGYKKHKISNSIKKFLRFGSKEGEPSGNKYDFGNCQTKTEINGSSQMLKISEEGMAPEQPSSRTPTPTNAAPTVSSAQVKALDRKPYGTIAGRPPPPPPPRVHSLDLLTRVGVATPHGGTVRPARPPPPARHNRVAPSFTAVFNNPNAGADNKPNESTSTPQHNSDNPDPGNPPSKPRRKASMNLDCVNNGISRDLETTYNHITTLNLETLKLIASQTPMKITSASLSKRNNGQLKWTNFQMIQSCTPLGHGCAFYTATLGDESCVLLIQESATAPNFSAPFEFPCVETSATFEDYIPDSYVTWKASEYVTNGSTVKAFVSVMPKFNMYTMENYMRHSQVPLLHKYFALLQAMTYWDKEKMSDLLVLVQNMDERDGHFTFTSAARGNSEMSHQSSSSPSSVLVYVQPIPHLSNTSGQMQTGYRNSSSKAQLCVDFEKAMKQLLLNGGSSSDGTIPLLGDNDRQVLQKRLYENKTKTVQDQFRLFLQVKLFAPKRDSDEMERFKKLRSERAIQQWLDRERAMCMKEAVEQTLQRNVESSISPYKRSYLEFLLTPENSAKAVLEMLIDLLE